MAMTVAGSLVAANLPETEWITDEIEYIKPPKKAIIEIPSDKNRVVEIAAQFIKKHEGFSPHLYKDPCSQKPCTISCGAAKRYDGNLSIGYGTSLKDVIDKYVDECIEMSPWQGNQLVYQYLHMSYDDVFVEQKAPKIMTPYKKAALLNFVYNFGLGAYNDSTLKKKLMEGCEVEAVEQFDRWVYVNKKKNDGLIKRAKEVKALYMTGQEHLPDFILNWGDNCLGAF